MMGSVIMGDKQRLLVDVCCGPCAIPIGELYSNPEKITSHDFELTFYVTNSNIHPFSEYVKRLQTIRQVVRHYKNNIIIDNYSPKEWLETVKGLEQEPEGEKRCVSCYTYRLEKTAQYASTHSFKFFTTTLTTGPSKEAKIINDIGKTIAAKYALTFVELDLKKSGGFLKSVVMSKKLGLYRQNYCGCVFSINNPKNSRIKKLEKQALMH